jgi:hypothetical protein
MKIKKISWKIYMIIEEEFCFDIVRFKEKINKYINILTSSEIDCHW